jgi:hypothetical protein
MELKNPNDLMSLVMHMGVNATLITVLQRQYLKAFAAYNYGEGNLDKLIKKYLKTGSNT